MKLIFKKNKSKMRDERNRSIQSNSVVVVHNEHRNNKDFQEKYDSENDSLNQIDQMQSNK